MFFADAVKVLASGEKITRKIDNWKGCAIFVDQSPLGFGRIIWNQMNIPPSRHTPWSPTIDDLISSDWEIHVPRPGEPA